MDLAGWQPGKAGCSRPAGLQPSRRPLEAGRWQLQLALLLLEGQADWKEEAQRLGRLLRPKHDGGGAVFYSVVARDSLDTLTQLPGQLWSQVPDD